MNGRRDWRGIGCAAVAAASIAFPLGILVGGNQPSRVSGGQVNRPGPSGGQSPPGRNAHSPRVASDPYVIEQQRRVLGALEASCRQSGRHCAEAEQARLRIEEAEAGR